MYTELCFYVQKVLFFYGFREYFHKQNDRYFTILWKFDEKSANIPKKRKKRILKHWEFRQKKSAIGKRKP